MYKINITKECGCFKKSEYENNISFDSKDDALLQAKNMTDHMNNKFCGKHTFTCSEDNDNFTIAVQEKAKDSSSSCCGGGHC